MGDLASRIFAWGGILCATAFGAGLLLAGFVPPPSPSLEAEAVAAIYRANAAAIRAGMILGLVGMAGYIGFVAVIAAEMRRMQLPTRLPVYLQLGAGSIGVLTVMFPTMLLAVTAFRPERDPALTQLLNDTAWLLIITAFPTFMAQFGGIAAGILADRSDAPVFPRWAAYLNLWIMLLFIPGGLAFFFRSGPLAWNGIISFWLAAGAFFLWLVAMTPLVLQSIARRSPAERHNPISGTGHPCHR